MRGDIPQGAEQQIVGQPQLHRAAEQAQRFLLRARLAAASAPARSGPRRGARRRPRARGTRTARWRSGRPAREYRCALWWKMGTSRKACLAAQEFEVAVGDHLAGQIALRAPRPGCGSPDPPGGSFPGAASRGGARRRADRDAPCGRRDGARAPCGSASRAAAGRRSCRCR